MPCPITLIEYVTSDGGNSIDSSKWIDASGATAIAAT